jgi:hypothetical protein
VGGKQRLQRSTHGAGAISHERGGGHGIRVHHPSVGVEDDDGVADGIEDGPVGEGIGAAPADAAPQ